jgi:predicted nucleotidyltransferase
MRDSNKLDGRTFLLNNNHFFYAIGNCMETKNQGVLGTYTFKPYEKKGRKRLVFNKQSNERLALRKLGNLKTKQFKKLYPDLNYEFGKYFTITKSQIKNIWDPFKTTQNLIKKSKHRSTITQLIDLLQVDPKNLGIATTSSIEGRLKRPPSDVDILIKTPKHYKINKLIKQYVKNTGKISKNGKEYDRLVALNDYYFDIDFIAPYLDSVFWNGKSIEEGNKFIDCTVQVTNNKESNIFPFVYQVKVIWATKNLPMQEISLVISKPSLGGVFEEGSILNITNVSVGKIVNKDDNNEKKCLLATSNQWIEKKADD